MELIIPRLQELAKDSHKYHAKKDRKVQKSSFRDILKYIEDEEDFYERIAFSKREKLEIESWGMKKQYDQMCKVNIVCVFHRGPENFKKSRPKKLVKSNKSISRKKFFEYFP